MKKNTHFIISVDKNGKKLAYALTVNNSNNPLSVLHIDGIQSVNVADSKKEAEKIARFWNERYKENGIYMFS